MSPVHTCHARGCEVATSRKMFMCRRHWFMLPQTARDAVWAAYTSGQENNPALVSDKYLTVTRIIIKWLADTEAREGKTT